MSKHTELPWDAKARYVGGNIVPLLPNAPVIAVMAKTAGDIAYIANYPSDDQDGLKEMNANAELIVRACNNHYKLLEACKEADRVFSACGESAAFIGMGPAGHSAISNLKAAIDAAEGSE